MDTQAKPRRRHYSDEERATILAALEANSGNVQGTAKQFGIPETTLRQWVKLQRNPTPAQVSDQKRGDLKEKLDEAAWMLIGYFPEAAKVAAEKGQISGLATAFGIAVDKARLLRGQPTSITQAYDLSRLTEEQLAALEAIAEAATPTPDNLPANESGD